MNMAETSIPQEAGPSVGDIFVARQPIFDAGLSVYAYELLYRSGATGVANVTDGNAATSQVMINAFLGIGMETLTDNRLSFINLTREFIVGQLPMPLPPEVVVLEILEDIEVDEELLSALKAFSQRGYTIALDDYVFEDDKTPLFDIIDIVKIDLMECDRERLEDEVERLKSHGVKLLAEKVETQEEFELCKALGFDYYQGYFFSKPKILSGQSLKDNRVSLMKILATLQDPNCDVSELELLIKQDVSISYKILRIINSAFYNLQREINSVKQAIVALGLKTIREWLTVITLTDIDDKPPELILACLQRARMLQTLSKAAGLNEDAGFTAGLFSSLDALMDQPMDEVLGALPLTEELKEALLKREGNLGTLLQTAMNYERGDWQGIDLASPMSAELNECYLESLSWASELVSRLKT
ncbi:MAG: HDOD domain-containing protein [Pseudohongiella sp.]|jgi:c-di-GMP phosphodiesterase|nr:HDOD domain-containing protein [Pseudohongiella sp.]